MIELRDILGHEWKEGQFCSILGHEWKTVPIYLYDGILYDGIEACCVLCGKKYAFQEGQWFDDMRRIDHPPDDVKRAVDEHMEAARDAWSMRRRGRTSS